MESVNRQKQASTPRILSKFSYRAKAINYRALLNKIFTKLTDQLSFEGSWIENHLDEFIQKLR
jgi:hypothetical protein